MPKFNVLHLQTKQIQSQNVIIKPKTSFYLPTGQYDIVAISENIRTTLQKNVVRMEDIVKRLKQIEINIQNNPKEEVSSQEEIFNLNREYRKLKEITTPIEFEKDSDELLELYKTYKHCTQDDFFGNANGTHNIQNLNIVIDHYVSLAKRYIEIPPRK